jgi:hypothetical protein
LVNAFFPDVPAGQVPLSRSAVLGNVSWEQQDGFASVLSRRHSLNVLVVGTADGVDRMLVSWPWSAPDGLAIPFAGIAMTSSLLPGVMSHSAACSRDTLGPSRMI